LTYNQKVNKQAPFNKSEIVRRPLSKKINEIDFDFKSKKKLSYKLEFELKNLPSKIDNIEKEINTLSNQLSDPDFYLNDPDGFLLASENLAIARSELEKYELRWLELEELKTD